MAAVNSLPIPPSLNTVPATSVPLYFELTGGLTEKWMDQDTGDIPENIVYRLPPPKSGLNFSTNSANSDEVSLMQIGLGGAAATTGVSQVVHSVYKSIQNIWTDEASESANSADAGGSLIPHDKTRIRYRGGNKRSYLFTFELWSYNNEDAVAISNFVRTMHACTMTQTVAAGDRDPAERNLGLNFRVPPLFIFKVLDAAAGNVDITKRFFVDPKPCLIINFGTSMLNEPAPALTNTKWSARTLVTMTLAEVEPVAWDGALNDGKVVLQSRHNNTCVVN
jgi:hypothetical protein